MQVLGASPAIHIPATLLSDSEFATAYQIGFPITTRYLRSAGANRDTAEEVSQAAWARAWQYRSQLADPRAIVAWVNTIARNLYWVTMSQQRRLVQVEDRQVPASPWQVVEINRLLKSCSLFETKLLKLYYFEGYSSFEIAQSECVKPATLRVRLMRLRSNLRSRMDPISISHPRSA